MKRRILFVIVALELTVCASAQRITAVRFGKLWDGERVIDGALVVIENGRIRNVQAETRRRRLAQRWSTGPAITACPG
jgi:imidazolonepropionase-like amidohydrolase